MLAPAIPSLAVGRPPAGLVDVAEEALGEGSSLTAVLELIALGFELVGVAILAVGGLVVAGRAVVAAAQRRPAYSDLRKGLGRVLLLGLEVLVAADVVRTVAVDTTIESVAILGLLVVVRTVLSFALSAEIDGVVPWRRTEVEARLSAQALASADGGQEPGRAAPGGERPPGPGRRNR